MLISKTDYLVWRECPHNAWIKKWKPDIYYTSPLSDFDKNLIATGNQVEEKARELFLDAVLVEGRDEYSLKKTKELLLNKTATIFQACFSDSILFAAVDILKQNIEGELCLYEVKASSATKLGEDYGGQDGESNEGDVVVDFRDAKVVEKYRRELLKDPHLFDLAFQVYLSKSAGYNITGAFLIRLNANYIRGGSLNLKKLFVVEDVSKYVDEILPLIESDVKKMTKFLNSPQEPKGPCCCFEKGRSRHCTTFEYHNKPILKDVIDYSVHDLTRIRGRKLKELIDSKIYDILDIPDDFELSPKMKKQVDTHKRGRADIDHDTIREELKTLRFPLYFLDYESFNPAIPRFTGYRPYQHIPFQYSLHLLTKEAAEKGAEPTALEPFFYMGKEDPSPLFVADLKKKIGKAGSIIVWNRTFEESLINKYLAVRLPEYAEFLQSVNSRIFDLMTIFSKQLHIHPDFHGSASIKKVLPVLRPDLSYKELDIGNGSEAMNIWNKLVTEDMLQTEREEIKKSMLEYCGLDTYAMYAIWKKLCDII